MKKGWIAAGVIGVGGVVVNALQIITSPFEMSTLGDMLTGTGWCGLAGLSAWRLIRNKEA